MFFKYGDSMACTALAARKLRTAFWQYASIMRAAVRDVHVGVTVALGLTLFLSIFPFHTTLSIVYF